MYIYTYKGRNKFFMNEKELLDLEFAKYIPLIEEARKNGKNKFEYNGCSVEYYKKLDGEELNITNAQRDNRGIVKEGPEINIDFGKNGDKRIAYIGHCPKVPWSDDYTIIFVEISQYKDNITYMGNGIYSNMDALNFKDRKVSGVDSIMEGISQDIEAMEKYRNSFKDGTDYSSISQETIEIVKQRFAELQELISVLGIDKSVKQAQLQGLMDRKAQLLQELADVEKQISQINTQER